MSEPEYLTVLEASTLLRFDVTAPSNPAEALRKWLRRNAVPVYHRGRTLLLKRGEIVAVLVGEGGKSRRGFSSQRVSSSAKAGR